MVKAIASGVPAFVAAETADAVISTSSTEESLATLMSTYPYSSGSAVCVHDSTARARTADMIFLILVISVCI